MDFSDVRTILKDQGLAHMGVGVAKGENRIVEAVRLAVNCPLLETTIEGAKGVILNIVGGNDLTLDEVQTAATLVQSVVDYSANIIFGACIDSNIADEVEVTVIATGFPHIENMYNAKDERNVASRNFFVNRGLPEREGGAAQQTQQAQPVQSAPSYVRMPLNNTMQGQQPPVYRQPYQQQAQAARQEQYQQQYVQQPQYQQQARPQADMGQAPQYQQQYAQQDPYARTQGQQMDYRQAAPQYQQSAPQQRQENSDKELPTFVQRLFKKK